MNNAVTGLRSFASRSTGLHPVKLAAIAIGIPAAIVASAILYHDVPDVVTSGTHWMRFLFRQYSYLASYALLYVEESGIPLPAPGDVFVMYVGAHVPRNLASWIIAWLGLIAAVVLGASNLFFISKRFGRRLAEGRFGTVVHLSPERLERAERWFQRYGVVAIIFGRHIPGFRVPITVAAGVLKVKYPQFAASVAVSTAIWAGVVLAIGVNYGQRMGDFLRLHRETYWLWAAAVGVMVILIAYRIYRAGQHSSPSTSPTQ